ncbi:MAG: M28 family peptidase [Armatimonadetes bacterium]|nr:M28 family peptidase [Armatimonadota bacterium]
MADRDPTPADRNTPIPGANDGASGVAVLTELGRAFQATPPPVTVALVALDLEDSGNTALTTGQPNQGYSIGTQHFVDNIGRWRPTEGVIVDMVGDRNLKLLREPNSVASDGALVNAVWSAGQRLGFGQFDNGSMVSLIDDHIPFIQAGIKCIDIIDFDYPGPGDSRFWHTLDDVPANCDGSSLRAVGQTLLEVIYNR